jgi:hypothetical protein
MWLERHFNDQGHVRRFVVTNEGEGWEIREEEDSAVLRRTVRQDWHRVEMDIHLFELRAQALKGEGWIENTKEARLSAQQGTV